MPLFSKRKRDEERVLPTHIAIIMDGNGRWAKRRKLPRTAGHVAGSKNFKDIARYCNKIGLEYLTVYALSLSYYIMFCLLMSRANMNFL